MELTRKDATTKPAEPPGSLADAKNEATSGDAPTVRFASWGAIPLGGLVAGAVAEAAGNLAATATNCRNHPAII